MIPLLAAVIALATPPPAAHERINCPFFPIFFDNGQTGLSGQALRTVEEGYGWVLDAAREDVLVLLRTYTREAEAIGLAEISAARADAVRAVLVSQGIPGNHILVAHEYREGSEMASQDSVGGWVYPEFYVSPAVMDRLTPNDGAVC